MIAVFGVVAFVRGYVGFQNRLARLSEYSTARDPSRYLEQHPNLVFRNVVFQKYLVWGQPAGATPQFETLLVYHVEGNASLILPLHSLTIVEAETDNIQYKDAKTEKFLEGEAIGCSYTIKLGKIETSGHEATTEFSSADEAVVKFEKVVKEKLKKGYKEV